MPDELDALLGANVQADELDQLLAAGVSERPAAGGQSPMDKALLGTPPVVPVPDPNSPFKFSFAPSQEFTAPSGTVGESESTAVGEGRKPITPESTPAEVAVETALRYAEAPLDMVASMALGVAETLDPGSSGGFPSVKRSLARGTDRIEDMVAQIANVPEFEILPVKPTLEEARPTTIIDAESNIGTARVTMLDAVRIAQAERVARSFGLDGLTGKSVMNRGGQAMMDGLIALGDLSLLTEFTEASQKALGEIQAGKPSVQSSSVAMNVIANLPGEVLAPLGVELVAGLAPIEMALLTGAKLVPKFAGLVDRAIPASIRLGGGKAYEATAEFIKRRAFAGSLTKVQGAAKGAMVDPIAAEAGSAALREGNDILMTTLKPLPLPRLFDTMKDSLLKARGNLAKGAVYLRTALDKDVIELLPPEWQYSAMRMRTARDAGYGEAGIRIITDFDEKLFGDVSYDMSAQVSDKLGFFRQAGLAPTAESIQEAGRLLSLTPEDAVLAGDYALRNIPLPNPRMQTTYEFAGRMLLHAQEFFPELVEKLDWHTFNEMRLVDSRLVNPANPVGALTKDMIKEAEGVPVERIAEARTKAWENTWKDFTTPDPDGNVKTQAIRDTIEAMTGDATIADEVLVTMDHYMKMNRGTVELEKLRLGYDLREGLYVHHMMSDAPVRNIIPSGRPQVPTAASKRQRMGKVEEMQRVAQEEVFEYNIRSILQKDMGEVFASRNYKVGFDDLVTNQKLIQTLPKNWHVDKKTGRIIDEHGETTVFKEMSLVGLDRFAIKSLPFFNPAKLEKKVADQVREILDKPMAVEAVDDIFRDIVSSDDISRLLAIVGEKKLIVHTDLNDYLVNMRREQGMLASRYYDSLHTQGDFGAPGLEAIPKMAGAVNAVLKPIATGADIGGIGQRITINSNLFGNLGPKATADIIRNSQRFIDERDIQNYIEAMQSGAMAYNRIGISELTIDEAQRMYAQIPLASRWLASADRSMYSNSLRSLGFDQRTRLGLIRYIQDNRAKTIDQMWSNPVTKKVGQFAQDGLVKLMGPDFKQFFRRNGDIEELKIAGFVKSILGAYDPSSMSASQAKYAKNFFTFYGWWRGTFTPMMSLPFRHPLYAGVYPLTIANTMNYAFSGKQMWDNPPGRRFQIQVDPEYLGAKFERLATGRAIPDVHNERGATYLGLPTPFRRSLNIFMADDSSGVSLWESANAASEGKSRQALTILAHTVPGIVNNVVQTGIVQQVWALDKAKRVYDLFEEAATRPFDDSMKKATLLGLGTINPALGEMYNQATINDWDVSIETLGALGTVGLGAILGQQVTKFPGNAKAAFWNQSTITEGGVPTTEASRSALTQSLRENLTRKDWSNWIPNAVMLQRNRAVANEMTNNYEKRKQLFHVIK